MTEETGHPTAMIPPHGCHVEMDTSLQVRAASAPLLLPLARFVASLPWRSNRRLR
jgi:hypothetical protein